MIDFADNPKEKMTADYALLKYEDLTRALDDIFKLNKNLMSDLGKIEVYLMKILKMSFALILMAVMFAVFIFVSSGKKNK